MTSTFIVCRVVSKIERGGRHRFFIEIGPDDYDKVAPLDGKVIPIEIFECAHDLKVGDSWPGLYRMKVRYYED